MHLKLSGARALVAIAAVAGVTGTVATTTACAKPRHAAQLHKSPARADLVARGLTLQRSDDGFDVKATIANIGSKFATTSDVVIAVSNDTQLDGNDEVLDDYSLPRLGVGIQRAFETDVEMPDDLPDGQLYLLVCADGNAAIREKSETNNCVSQSFNTADTNALANDASDANDDPAAADDGASSNADDGATDPGASVTLTDGQ